MRVLLAAWSLTVAALYATLTLAQPAVANALSLCFVVAVLVPAAIHDFHKRDRHGPS